MSVEKKRDARQKLDEQDVLEILRLNDEGVTRKSIARHYNVSYEHVRRILCGLKWRSVHDKLKHQHVLESLKRSAS